MVYQWGRGWRGQVRRRAGIQLPQFLPRQPTASPMLTCRTKCESLIRDSAASPPAPPPPGRASLSWPRWPRTLRTAQPSALLPSSSPPLPSDRRSAIRGSAGFHLRLRLTVHFKTKFCRWLPDSTFVMALVT
ncbi:hypothetical protein ANO11243_060090 [Dothideomycetidae sp. 11243]|nr:hypothetical protein ANO11243_060090 [fungal sp. No.11243]